MAKRAKFWQCEIIAKDDLLDESGDLIRAGYARQPYLKYQRRFIKAKKSRIKEWDYYLIYNNKGAVALTVDDNGYMGMLSASVINFENATETTKSKIKWFTYGKMNLPESSIKGDVNYEDKKIQASFKIDPKTKNREIKYFWKNFKDKKDLSVSITLTDEPKESMNIATPFEKPKHFYYNRKIIGFKASGKVMLGEDVVLDFGDEAYGLLDWGRGVWTYKNTWIWGALMMEVEGHMLGVNLGYGFGDPRFATENMAFYDGIATKLENINVDFNTKNGKDDYNSAMEVTSSDGRFNAIFTPLIDRYANTDLIVLGSCQHQVFGLFNGSVTLQNGEVIPITNAYGFIEKVKNKW